MHHVTWSMGIKTSIGPSSLCHQSLSSNVQIPNFQNLHQYVLCSSKSLLKYQKWTATLLCLFLTKEKTVMCSSLLSLSQKSSKSGLLDSGSKRLYRDSMSEWSLVLGSNDTLSKLLHIYQKTQTPLHMSVSSQPK